MATVEHIERILSSGNKKSANCANSQRTIVKHQDKDNRIMDKVKLEKLCEYFATYKQREEEAKAARVEVESQIAAMLVTKDEGTDKANAGPFKITVTSKLSRTLDYEAYQAIATGLPVQCVDLKPTINLKNLRVIEAVDPALVAQFVTTKPAKASVKVEVA